MGSPRPGLELVSPALAGRFLTTAPLGKSYFTLLLTEQVILVGVVNDESLVVYNDNKHFIQHILCCQALWCLLYLLYLILILTRTL